jgi:hypothetical protein
MVRAEAQRRREESAVSSAAWTLCVSASLREPNGISASREPVRYPRWASSRSASSSTRPNAAISARYGAGVVMSNPARFNISVG